MESAMSKMSAKLLVIDVNDVKIQTHAEHTKLGMSSKMKWKIKQK